MAACRSCRDLGCRVRRAASVAIRPGHSSRRRYARRSGCCRSEPLRVGHRGGCSASSNAGAVHRRRNRAPAHVEKAWDRRTPPLWRADRQERQARGSRLGDRGGLPASRRRRSSWLCRTGNLSMTAVESEFEYNVFGLQVRSEIPLPGLLPGASGEPGDVTVRVGRISEDQRRPGLYRTGGALLLVVPDVARFLIAEGREITVEPAADAPESNVRLYLMGSAFGALIHQRGLLPLH